MKGMAMTLSLLTVPIQKDLEIQQNQNLMDMEDHLFATPVQEVHLEITIKTNSGCIPLQLSLRL